MRNSTRIPLMLHVGALVMILGLLAGPVAAQTICQACGQCDQDGDGLFRDKRRCQLKCNPDDDPGLIDPNDNDAVFCDDPGDSNPQIEVEFTDSEFAFLSPPEVFTLNDRGNRANNDEAVTLLVPVDGDPGTVEPWDAFFAANCPTLLTAAPFALEAAPDSIELAKSAGDVRVIFADVDVDPAVLQEGIDSAEITFQLIGKNQGTEHFPTRPDDPAVDWVFTMYRIWGQSTSSGPKKHCDGPGEVLIPDLSEHTLQMRVVP